MTAPSSSVKQAYLAIEKLTARLARVEAAAREPIAIVGMACRFPGGAVTPERYWELLRGGVDAITEIPPDRWPVDEFFDPDVDAAGKINTRYGGFVDRIDQFDPGFFGISPREAASMDPQQRILLEATWEALERAGQAPDRLVDSRTGVFVGIVGNDYAQLQIEAGVAGSDMYYASGIGHSVASGRISYLLGLRGPSVSIDTACSSSLVAVHLAVQSLRAGESDMAIAGGTNAILAPELMMALARYRMLAPDGRCKTFDARADGFSRGEGCGVIVLKRLGDAIAAGDPITAVIRGSAINQDGPSSGLTAPNGPSQAAVIRAAVANAGLEPEDIGYVETHGTGTELGDPIEVQAIGAALGSGRPADRPVWIASVKTNLGHLEAAAGIAGLIKAALCIRHEAIPAHLHFETPSPMIPWAELPVRVPTAMTPWPTATGLHCGVSSFGFSGTNAHVVLGPAPAPRVERGPHLTQLLPLSARTPDALAATARAWADALTSRSDIPVADVCLTAATGRPLGPHRAVIAGGTVEELVAGLRSIADGQPQANVRIGQVARRDPPRIGFLFTGQGSQYPGMVRDLYQSEPVFRAAIDRCAELVGDRLGRPLTEIIFSAADASIDRTANTQPALFAVEHGLVQLWRSWGVTPAFVAGHSVGELVAACTAGVFPLEDAVDLVVERGRLLESLPDGGAMAAVFATEADVLGELAPIGDRVGVAGINGPEQTVISGDGAAVAGVLARYQARGVRVQPLTVSHAFHSPLVEPILDEFERAADRIKYAAPRIKLISNLTGQVVDAGTVGTGRYWRRHIREPVRFSEGITAAAALKPDVWLEVGPTSALLSMVKATLGDAGPALVASLRKNRPDRDQLLDAAGQLFLAGAELEWRAVIGAGARIAPELPTTPFDRERCWFSPGSARRRETRSGHPILGSRIRSASGGTIYESRLSASEPGYLRDHRVHGAVVMPATGFLEAFRVAAGSAGLDELVDVSVQEAMMLDEPPAGARVVQLTLDPGDGHPGARIASQGSADPVDGPWKVHATARMRRGSSEWPAPSLADGTARSRASRSIDDFYEGLTGIGLGFGDRFRTVRSIRAGDGIAVGEVALPESLAREAGRYQLHPVLLDGCLQLLGAALPVPSRGDVYLPIAIGGYRWRPTPGVSRCWSVAQIEGDGSDGLVRGSVRVHDESGALVAVLDDIRLKRTGRETLARLSDRWMDDALLEQTWHPTPRAAARTWSVESLAAAARDGLEGLAREADLPGYDAFLTGLEALCVDFTVKAFQDLGWSPAVGESVEVERLAVRLGVEDRHRQLLGRLLGILGEAGLTRRDGDRWLIVRPLPVVAPAEGAIRLAGTGSAGAELELVTRTGAGLAAALTGRQNPIELLFPGGNLDTAERMYRDAPSAKVFNGMMAAVAAAAQRAAGSRPLRVLEVGGGTGGTTAHVLPRLAEAELEYTFTDIGPAFVTRARERFGSQPGTRFAVFDLERSPAGQGIRAGGYDLIIASNVVHATADLRRTLGELRMLLAPGGVLAMLEVTTAQRWFDLTVGLTEGWWLFTDRELRPDYPTLPRDRWLSLLAECGYQRGHGVGGVGPGAIGSQSLILAQAPVRTTTSWIVFPDRGGAVAGVVARLRAAGDECLVMDPAMDPAELPAIFQRTPVERVLDARALDADGQSPEAALELTTAAHAIARAVLLATASPPQLIVLTRGASACSPGERPSAPAAAALAGMLRSLALEHPELHPTWIDLDPAGSGTSAEAEALERELGGDRDEPQVALRGEARLAARLGRSRPAATPPTPYRVAIGERGRLEQLRIEPASRRQPGPGEVEVGVEATGLNFKDVLNVLGMYPGDPGPLGAECAGTVTAVGAGVAELQPGDPVLAVIGGSFASHVIVPERFVRPRPANLSIEEAASSPVAYLTARYCLGEVARMKAGDRVLVHAAAGGVGLAAVRLAQRIGAVVIATAGSAAKREFLRSQGVAHVFDSRSPSFLPAVLEVTGGQGVDIVLNSLAGEMLDASFAAIGRDGRFVEMGKRGIWEPARVEALGRGIQYTVVDWGRTSESDPGLIAGLLAELTDDLAGGRLLPLPHHTFDLADVEQAFRFMAQARHTGKVVVRHRVPARPAVRPDGTYLITGGLRGLGLAVAEQLAERGAGRLVLIGRRGISRESESTVAAIRSRGVEVVAEAIDVADENAMAGLLGRLRSDGPPLRGVVHSAGGLDDSAFLGLTRERFARVFGAKVSGAEILDRLTRFDPVDWMTFFSSIAGTLGSRGQANHAAANAYLDALAARRRADGLPAVSIAWGAWSGIGAAADQAVQDRAATRGIGALTPAQGLALFERLSEGGPPAVVAAIGDWSLAARENAGLTRWLVGTDVLDAPDRAHLAAENGFVAQVKSAPAGRRRPLIAAMVRERSLAALGLPASRAVDPATPLGEMGLDSLLAVELRNTLGSVLGKPLPATLLFDYPTIDALTDFVTSQLDGENGPREAPPVKPDTVGSIEDLSDEEVDRLLAARARGKR